MREIRFQNGSVLPVVKAKSFFKRMLGLAFRDRFDGEGLLIMLPMRSNPKIWMWGMRFAIDILWIRDERIIKIEKEVAPPKSCLLSVLFPYCLKKYFASCDVDHILEVKAGFCRKNDISIGERICLSV